MNMVMTGALCEAMADSQHGMTKAPWFFRAKAPDSSVVGMPQPEAGAVQCGRPVDP